MQESNLLGYTTHPHGPVWLSLGKETTLVKVRKFVNLIKEFVFFSLI